MALTVRATELGYYGMERRDVGAVFEIRSEAAFSPRWMEKVKAGPVDRAEGQDEGQDEAHDAVEASPARKRTRESDKLKI